MEQTIIKVAIVDDHAFVREGIERILSNYEYFKVSLSVADGTSLLEALKRMSPDELPDVLILDIQLQDMSGYEAMDELNRQYPELKVLVSSMFDNEYSVIRMLHAGAKGFVSKGGHPKEFIEALDKVMDGELYFPSNVSAEQIERIRRGYVKVGLSEKEIQLLQYCCEDLSYKEMAQLMDISERTVHHYRDGLFLKLGVNSKTGLAMYAVSAGFK